MKNQEQSLTVIQRLVCRREADDGPVQVPHVPPLFPLDLPQISVVFGILNTPRPPLMLGLSGGAES